MESEGGGQGVAVAVSDDETCNSLPSSNTSTPRKKGDRDDAHESSDRFVFGTSVLRDSVRA